MRKQRSPWTKKQQFIFGIIVIVVTLIASLTAILIVATKPYVDAEKKVIAIAESKQILRLLLNLISTMVRLPITDFLESLVKVRDWPLS